MIVAAAGFLQYRKAASDRQTADRGGAALATVAVSMGDISSTVRITGTVIAERSAIIRAPRSWAAAEMRTGAVAARTTTVPGGIPISL